MADVNLKMYRKGHYRSDDEWTVDADWTEITDDNKATYTVDQYDEIRLLIENPEDLEDKAPGLFVRQTYYYGMVIRMQIWSPTSGGIPIYSRSEILNDETKQRVDADGAAMISILNLSREDSNIKGYLYRSAGRGGDSVEAARITVPVYASFPSPTVVNSVKLINLWDNTTEKMTIGEISYEQFADGDYTVLAGRTKIRIQSTSVCTVDITDDMYARSVPVSVVLKSDNNTEVHKYETREFTVQSTLAIHNVPFPYDSGWVTIPDASDNYTLTVTTEHGDTTSFVFTLNSESVNELGLTNCVLTTELSAGTHRRRLKITDLQPHITPGTYYKVDYSMSVIVKYPGDETKSQTYNGTSTVLHYWTNGVTVNNFTLDTRKTYTVLIRIKDNFTGNSLEIEKTFPATEIDDHRDAVVYHGASKSIDFLWPTHFQEASFAKMDFAAATTSGEEGLYNRVNLDEQVVPGIYNLSMANIYTSASDADDIDAFDVGGLLVVLNKYGTQMTQFIFGKVLVNFLEQTYSPKAYILNYHKVGNDWLLSNYKAL